ncbi:hypothetical protein ACVWXM_007727 [Bradyrhizobium sp. GM7.3]
MNALARTLVGESLEDAIWRLEARALIRAYLEYEWQYEHLADAIDPLQEFAEQSGLVAALGQDEVQRMIAAPFERFRVMVAAEIEAEFAPTLAPELPSDYAAQLVMSWELDDPRDRWRWTGELPPAPEKQPERRPRSVPQSTIDAFNFVVSSGDADRLRKWLHNHSEVAPALVREMA